MEQKSGATEMDYSDFSTPVVFKLYTELGETKEFKILLFDLPVVVINTPDNVPIKNKTDWVNNSTMRIIDVDGSVLYDGETGIKGRGNVSWLSYQKKSYSLKLPEKSEILDMKNSKRWVLLGTSGDYIKMRTPLCFKLCEMVGMEWSPSGRNVELILNDTILCNYYLCEQIRAEKNRVNITDMTPADTIGETITGGYLLEVSIEYDEQFKFRSQFFDMPFMLKSPDSNVPDQQLKWIEAYINNLEELLYDSEKVISGEYKKYLNEESFIKWWLVNELSTNIEEEYQEAKNFYMYKDRGNDSKLHASSPWDFDWGTFRSQASEDWICKNRYYYKQLFKNDGFVKKVKEEWGDFYPNSISLLESFIEIMREMNRRSVNRDRCDFPKIGMSPTNLDNLMKYDEGVDYVKNVLFDRIEWMNYQILSMKTN